MANMRKRTALFIAIGAVLIVLGGIGVAALMKSPAKTPAAQPTTTTTPSDSRPPKDTTKPSPDTSSQGTSQAVTAKADPSTLNSVAITPMSITVFYTKGTPGFAFSVLKTADQTQYVEFTSTDLVGTKCTDDQGIFATIIKNPSSSTAQTTTQTVTVGSDTYGLSLAGSSCTNNVSLLGKYQDGFKAGFSSLTAL